MKTCIRLLAISAVLITAVSAAGALVPAERADAGAVPRPHTAPSQSFTTLNLSAVKAPESKFKRLAATAQREGRVPVIVGLKTRFAPEGALRTADVVKQRSAISAARSSLIKRLAGTGFSVTHRYTALPYVSLSLSPRAVETLRASGLAATLEEDLPDQPTLDESGPLVEVPEAAAAGRSGKGQVIAILDSGVDKGHPMLSGKVVSEACYSMNGNCPGGSTESTAVGSGVPCTYAPACSHGTHVAGIAAGHRTEISFLGGLVKRRFSGTARDAGLISIQVFTEVGDEACDDLRGEDDDDDPCALTYRSDQLKGLERVLELRRNFGFNIAAVNMSLGSAPKQTGACNDDSRKAAIDSLRAEGVAVVISSGNDGSNNGVGAPGCISTAITVGNTTKDDEVAENSNSSTLVDLLAPGTKIYSAVPRLGSGVPGSGLFGFAEKSGTSMAAPHVAGAWASMRQVGPRACESTILANLQATGEAVTDSDNGVTRSRIRIFSATERLIDTAPRIPVLPCRNILSPPRAVAAP